MPSRPIPGADVSLGRPGTVAPRRGVEYLGRNDQQVKIRGFRIELGEIEAHLVRHSAVEAAVVLAREDNPGDKRLFAYVVPKLHASAASLSVDALRADLKAGLPEYMVPNAFVILDQLPLTANGKLDRRALPAAHSSAYTSRDYEPPCGEIEQSLGQMWQEVLRLERVGREDNFFELGGHSLLGMQLVARIESLLSVEVPVRLLFEYPILKQLAVQVEHLRYERLLAKVDTAGSEVEELLKTVVGMPQSQVQQLLGEFTIGNRP